MPAVIPLSVLREDVQEIQETPCVFCTNQVRYIIDFSIGVFSPAKMPSVSVNEESAIR